jgi:hypothetical protein
MVAFALLFSLLFHSGEAENFRRRCRCYLIRKKERKKFSSRAHCLRATSIIVVTALRDQQCNRITAVATTTTHSQ